MKWQLNYDKTWNHSVHKNVQCKWIELFSPSTNTITTDNWHTIGKVCRSINVIITLSHPKRNCHCHFNGTNVKNVIRILRNNVKSAEMWNRTQRGEALTLNNHQLALLGVNYIQHTAGSTKTSCCRIIEANCTYQEAYNKHPNYIRSQNLNIWPLNNFWNSWHWHYKI